MDPSSKRILVINCGSSSLKFGLFDANNLELQHEGLAGALNSENASLKIKNIASSESATFKCKDHQSALEQIFTYLAGHFDLNKSIAGIGHRIVHGGEHFKSSVKINDAIIQQIEECVPLAPLHNPANLVGIRLCETLLPDAPQIAVFDTAFHQSMPEHAYMYALPYRLYSELGVRRYGFHGSSHRYVARQAELQLGMEAGTGSFISAHLGNGASICAIQNGQSIDTSMGMTPLEGLVMGTRSGDIDPGIFDHLIRQGYTPESINQMLNKESGLLGISTLSNDMRELSQSAEQGDQKSQLAIDIFCYRLAKYIGAMMVPLEQLDALIFTGGIGENAAGVRAKTLSYLAVLGFKIDADKNSNTGKSEYSEIHTDDSHPILVICTDEEKMIAEDTRTIIQDKS